MKKDELLLLVGEIKNSQVVLGNINSLYVSYNPMFVDEDKRDLRDAVLLTEILCNTYTCLETILFRISRAFENHLDAQQWHKELLGKMRIEIPGIRKAVLSHESYLLLDELRRFRHFKRYYFDFEYDWAKLNYLKIVYEKLVPLIHKELDSYADFVLKLTNPK
ncbi:hypothetical protein [Geminocystis sp. GBBB08]|uniref:ribonuclease toxin HepT-like protein n=1 Tax=Geminocystis sp. GBBB08 TaxID=2604140 RepID=UPI0027E21E83|nr:hypothetical protein [Geminocystis sp. GBBB08]MBL1210292.1 hypothetical protein [Geminocystis sp. GBBB08]